MNCLLSQLSSFTAAIVGRTSRFVAKTSLNANPTNFSFPQKSLHFRIRSFRSELVLTRCYSTKKARKSSSSRLQKVEPETTMEQEKEKEKDAFFVVRKGDVVGIYKTLTDSQAQVGSSVCDPPVSVYKGYSLSLDTEEYLLSHGLKNALYTIRASDLKEDLFGTLLPCPFQDPSSTKGTTSSEDVSKKRPLGVLEQDHVKATGLASISEDPLRKQVKLDHASKAEVSSLENRTCILEFDGASKGNPGKSGAGAILRSIDGSVIYRLREGVGIATNNAAEYRAMILGMKIALQKGFTGIRIKGDSKLVCMQIDGSWKVKNENLSILYKVAKELKDKFESFQISHVLREFNSEADAQANLAIHLADGQVHEEWVGSIH